MRTLRTLFFVLTAAVAAILIAVPIFACDPGPCDLGTGICAPPQPEWMGWFVATATYADGSCLMWGGQIYDNCDGTRTYLFSGYVNPPYFCPDPSGSCTARQIYQSGWTP